MDASPAGIGHRIYLVRRALGPDARHELPQRAFADMLNAKAAELFPEEELARYDSSVVARLERGERRVTVPDLTIVAALDPKRRGLLWLIWNEREDPTFGARVAPTATGYTKLSSAAKAAKNKGA